MKIDTSIPGAFIAALCLSAAAHAHHCNTAYDTGRSVEWRAAVERLERAGHKPVAAVNPYWERQGRTFEDPDGYRVVLANKSWDR